MDFESFAVCSLEIYRGCFIQSAKSNQVIFWTDSLPHYGALNI